MSDNIIKIWLKSLNIEEYSESFIDNGYDDLETVKQIKREDLVAIGVSEKEHQDYLLDCVKVLKEKGAAWVYLLCQETTNADVANDVSCDSDNYGSSGVSSYKSSIYQPSEEGVSDEYSSSEGNPYSTINNTHAIRGVFINLSLKV